LKKIVLASRSLRRKEILQNLNLEFDIVYSDSQEYIDRYLSFEENVERIALDKALNVAEKIDEDAVIISAETMIIYEKLIGKPKSEQEAYDILRSLSGKHHEVITGVCVFDTGENRGIFEHRKTKVKFVHLSDDFIWRYINSGETWERAGAYAIKDAGALMVEKIEGCYTNVMGLPVSLLGEMLGEFDIQII
jgi:septum formation protein